MTFLPHILDCQSQCRNDYLNMLRELADKFKKNHWGFEIFFTLFIIKSNEFCSWVWTEAAKQLDLEQSFGIGGFGYPAMIAVNARKMKYSTLTGMNMLNNFPNNSFYKGSFGKSGISEFLRDLSYGKGKTSSVSGSNLPALQTVEPWDGKDAEPPTPEPEEDLDLSDVELEDLEAVAAEKKGKEKSEL